MSTTPDNTNPPAPTAEDLDKMRKALEAEREERKSDRTKHSTFRASVAKVLGLPEDASSDAILARVGDAEKVIGERAATLTKERDEATARVADVESRWASERVDGALRDAFAKSGADPRNAEDYLTLARGAFALDDKGNVRTKDDIPNTLPGVDPATWIVAELRAKRPHWWPTSQGGGARGGKGVGNPTVPGDASCFKPGPTFNLTAQGQYAKTYGMAAAERASQLFGGGHA